MLAAHHLLDDPLFRFHLHSPVRERSVLSPPKEENPKFQKAKLFKPRPCTETCSEEIFTGIYSRIPNLAPVSIVDGCEIRFAPHREPRGNDVVMFL